HDPRHRGAGGPAPPGRGEAAGRGRGPLRRRSRSHVAGAGGGGGQFGRARALPPARHGRGGALPLSDRAGGAGEDMTTKTKKTMAADPLEQALAGRVTALDLKLPDPLPEDVRELFEK